MVWDWVEFFVPYMSDEGVSKLISTLKSSEWVGAIDMMTGKLLEFTQEQIDRARNNNSNKAFLTREDINAHALMIIQLNGQRNCVDFMFPYMINEGILDVLER